MKYLLILALITILYLLFLQPVYKPTSTQPSVTLTYALINDYKRSVNLKPTILSAHTCQLADIRADDIQTEFNHRLFLIRAGEREMGEILSSDYYDERKLVRAWLDSPTHKRILDMDFRYGCLRCKDGKCVMIFEK